MRILFVAARLPTHGHTGDRARTYYFVNGLSQGGHQVDLIGFADLRRTIATNIQTLCRQFIPVQYDEIEFQQPRRGRQLLQTLSGAAHGYPRRVWQLHSPQLLRTFADLLRGNAYDIVHFQELGVAELLFGGVLPPGQATVYDLVDAISLAVHSSLTHRFDVAWPLRRVEVSQLRRLERRILARVDAGIVISDRDRAFIGAPSLVHVIPHAVVVPPWVEPQPERYDLVFAGDMSARANIDAVCWFVREVLTLVWRSRPATTFCIVGRDPTPVVRALESTRVTVTGQVDDTTLYLRQASVVVAPVRFGAGQKTKVVEALACGAALVATREANVGTDAPDRSAIVLVDRAEDMSNAILQLLTDPALRARLGRAGYAFVREHFTWERAAERLLAVYETVVNHERPVPASKN